MKDDFREVEEELMDKRKSPESFDLIMFIIGMICLSVIIIQKFSS